ncbi:MAG TPA: hypothetical protein VGS12_11240 [Caulobacteraceae bacterium]|nr:hypothetical protein [Caulobacteraceae bacterium]
MKIRTLVSALLATGLALGGSTALAKGASVKTICQADFQKLCPTATPNRGAVMRCVKTRLDQVSAECKTAVQAAQAKNASRRAARKTARATKASAPAG